MDSIFKICKNGACGITVTGLEKDNDEYLNEDNIIVSTRNYAYSQTVTLNALISIQASGDEIVKVTDVVEHVVDCIDESEIEMPIDGLYQVSHLIVPTNEWLSYVLDREPTALSVYDRVYIYDTTNEAFAKYVNSELVYVTTDEVLAINANPPVDVTEKTSTIIRSDKNTFCMCYINECFYRLCKDLFNNMLGKCSNRLDDVKTKIYNRDFIWMSINVIKYLIELKQFYEAQRVLEDVIQCGGICDRVLRDKPTIGGGGCGCNTRT